MKNRIIVCLTLFLILLMLPANNIFAQSPTPTTPPTRIPIGAVQLSTFSCSGVSTGQSSYSTAKDASWQGPSTRQGESAQNSENGGSPTMFQLSATVGQWAFVNEILYYGASNPKWDVTINTARCAIYYNNDQLKQYKPDDYSLEITINYQRNSLRRLPLADKINELPITLAVNSPTFNPLQQYTTLQKDAMQGTITGNMELPKNLPSGANSFIELTTSTLCNTNPLPSQQPWTSPPSDDYAEGFDEAIAIQAELFVVKNADLNLLDAKPVQVVVNPKAIIKDKDAVLRLEIDSTYDSTRNAVIELTYDNERIKDYGPSGKDGVPLHPGKNIVYVPGGPVFDESGKVLETAWTPSATGNVDFLKWTSEQKYLIKAKVLPLPDEKRSDNNEKPVDITIVASKKMYMLFIPVEFPMDKNNHIDANLPLVVNNWLNYLSAVYPVAPSNIKSSICSTLYWPQDPPPKYTIYASDTEQVVEQKKYELRNWFYEQIVNHSMGAKGYFKGDCIFRVVYVLPDSREVLGPNVAGLAIGMMYNYPKSNQVPVVLDEYRADSVTFDKDKSRTALAHEVGHTFYLRHPQDLGPKTGSISYGQINRYWVERRDYNESAKSSTFMSYDAVNNNVGSLWIDTGRYQDNPLSGSKYKFVWKLNWNLFDQITSGLPKSIGLAGDPSLTGEMNMLAASDPSILTMEVNFFKNGTVNSDCPWYLFTQGVPSLMPGNEGNYSVVLLDRNGVVLKRIKFDVSFKVTCEEGENMTSGEVDEIPFPMDVEFANGTKCVQIQDYNNQTLFGRTISDNSPEVKVTFPAGGEQIGKGNVLVTWNETDADGDKLAYNIGYSSDGGNTWNPIALNLDQTSYVWSTTELAPGGNYSIRVIATDGVNIGQGDSNGVFTVDPSIVNPPITPLPKLNSNSPSGNNSSTNQPTFAYGLTIDYVLWVILVVLSTACTMTGYLYLRERLRLKRFNKSSSKPKTMPRVNTCKYCTTANRGSAKHCRNCGKKLG